MTSISGYIYFELQDIQPQLAARRADSNLEKYKKIKHYYAVDTNILYFLAQPILTGLHSLDQRSKGLQRRAGVYNTGPHLGSPFKDDSADFHAIICVALANYIADFLPGTSPIFIPDELWPEVDGVFNFVKDIDREHTTSSVESVLSKLTDKMLHSLTKKIDKGTDQFEEFSVAIRRLVKLKMSPQNGGSRLSAFGTSRRLASLSARPVIPGQVNKFRSSFGSLKGHEFNAENVEKDWARELRKTSKVMGLEADVKALSRIQLRNLKAERLNSKERVLYITADKNVLDAANKVKVDKIGTSAAKSFVRHPAAFLNDIGLGLERTSIAEQFDTVADANAMLDFVNLMLAELPFDGGSGNVSERSQTLSDEKWMVQQFRERWQALTGVQEDQLFFELGLHELRATLRHSLAEGDVTKALMKVRDETIRLEANAWQKCFELAAELSLKYLPKAQPQTTRVTAAICFEGWPRAGAAVEQFKIWGYTGIPALGEYVKLTKALKDDVEDKTGYAYFLASAAFFAARADWAPAASLASFAREIALHVGDLEKTLANGREALFFETVCRRHLISSLVEVDVNKDRLHECKRIYEREKKFWPSASAPEPMNIVPERFLLEELDLEQVAICLNQLQGIGGDERQIHQNVEHLFQRYSDLLRLLKREVTALVSKNREDLSALGTQTHIAIQTEFRAIMSVLLLASTDIFPLEKLPEEHIVNAVNRLKKIRDDFAPNSQPLRNFNWLVDGSLFTQIAPVAAGALLCEKGNLPQNMQLIRSALNLLNEYKKANRTFSVQDKMRFDSIQAILQRNLGKPSP